MCSHSPERVGQTAMARKLPVLSDGRPLISLLLK